MERNRRTDDGTYPNVGEELDKLAAREKPPTCHACQVEAEFGTEEDPHPIPRRFHKCSPLTPEGKIKAPSWEVAYERAHQELKFAAKAVGDTAGWSGSSGNWPLQFCSGVLDHALDFFKPKKDKTFFPLMLQRTAGMRTALEMLVGVMQEVKSPAKEVLNIFDDLRANILWALDPREM